MALSSNILQKLRFCSPLYFSSRHLCFEKNKNSWEHLEKTTHTGQEFSKDDYRNVRFISKGKEINERFAIDLIAEVPPKVIKGRSTFCDGGGGPLGHPKVYINLDKPGDQFCGYCGLRFEQEPHH